MATALAVRHGAFGRATLNRLGRPLATHAHREGHVIVTLSGSGSAIEVDGAPGDASDGVPGRASEGATRLPLDPGHAVLISSWCPHRFVPGPRPSDFLTLYIAPEWFAASLGSRGMDTTAAATADAVQFGAGRVAMDEALVAMADDTAALLAADARSGAGERRRLRCDEGQSGEQGGEQGSRGGEVEPILGELTGALHARSWGRSWNRPGPSKSDPGAATFRCASATHPIRAGAGCPPATMPARSVGDFRIRRALRLMREAVAEGCEVDLDRTARESGLSRPHFFKLFRAHVGVTPGTYLNSLKMERSYERLSAGRETVTAIGLDLGFASQASFTRFFIAQSGIAPSDYRQAVAARRTGTMPPPGMASGMASGIGAYNKTVGYA